MPEIEIDLRLKMFYKPQQWLSSPFDSQGSRSGCLPLLLAEVRNDMAIFDSWIGSNMLFP